MSVDCFKNSHSQDFLDTLSQTLGCKVELGHSLIVDELCFIFTSFNNPELTVSLSASSVSCGNVRPNVLMDNIFNSLREMRKNKTLKLDIFNDDTPLKLIDNGVQMESSAKDVYMAYQELQKERQKAHVCAYEMIEILKKHSLSEYATSSVISHIISYEMIGNESKKCPLCFTTVGCFIEKEIGTKED